MASSKVDTRTDPTASADRENEDEEMKELEENEEKQKQYLQDLLITVKSS